MPGSFKNVNLKSLMQRVKFLLRRYPWLQVLPTVRVRHIGEVLSGCQSIRKNCNETTMIQCAYVGKTTRTMVTVLR